MIHRIAGYTLATDHFDDCVAAYGQFLDYRCTHSGRVSVAMATHWHAPACVDRRYALLSPAGDGETFVRVVESRVPADYQPYESHGWLAAELIVQDVDALAAALHDSPFRALRPPANLSISDQIRAVQVQGPAREVLYLTQIKSRIAGLDTPEARCAIDRPFIMVAGGDSMNDMRDWYCQTLGAGMAPSVSAVISAMSACRSLPLDARYELAALPLGGQCFLELDVMPAGTGQRVTLSGELSPGIAMTSFEMSELPKAADGTPQPFDAAPYFGRRSLLLYGAAGELVELLER
jgi:hypothetical protein